MDWEFEEQGAVRKVPVFGKMARLVVEVDQASYIRCLRDRLDVGEVLPVPQGKALAEILADPEGICRRSVGAVIESDDPDATVEAVLEVEIRVARPEGGEEEGEIQLAVVGDCAWDTANGFGVVWRLGKVQATGGVTAGTLWSEALELISDADLAAENADSETERVVDGGPSALEKAMIDGDFALVDTLLPSHEALSESTLQCALSQPEAIMKRLVRLLRSRRLLPKDPSLADYVETEAARKWLAPKLR